MQLTNLKKTTIGKKVLVDDNTIIIFIPSLSKKIWSSVYETPFLMSNCKGIIIPNKIFKINKRSFNGRIHYLEAKKQFVELKNVIRKIPVFSSIGSIKKGIEDDQKKKIKQFYFYDMSMVLKSVNSFSDKLPTRRIFQILIDEVRSIYNSIKNEYPRRKVLLVIDIQNQNDLMYFFLSNFRQLKNLLKDSFSSGEFFDKFAFVSVNQRLLPVLEYNDKNELTPIFPMINRLDQFIEDAELADEIDGAPAISDIETAVEPQEPIPNKSIASKIIDALQNPDSLNKQRNNFLSTDQTSKEKELSKTTPLEVKAHVSDDDNGVKIELDNRALSKIMRHYKVTNSDIVANVKTAIDNYIKETGAVPTKTNAELLVLKAISKSVHGTDNVDEVYLANPNLLFDKLKEINVFAVPLEIPKTGKNYPFEMNEIVTLKNITGQHRQLYEFTELIHENIFKVFSILENQKHPIKVLGITWKLVDNNLDRYIEYTIRLKNMDGNKKEYEIKLNIPTIINEKAHQ